MKDMDAMMLAVVRERMRQQRRPARDVVLTFTADEKAGGTWGARFLVDKHPELFEDVPGAVGEVGGFSLTLGGQRLYLLQTAEKGMAWLRLTARGTAGHGSMVHTDNAVTELAEAIGGLGRHDEPTILIPSVQAPGRCIQGTWHRIAPNDHGQLLSKIGSVSRIIGATLHNTVNPTVFRAGYKVNVVPQAATAEVDGRFLPGYEEEFLAELDGVLGPGVTREFIHQDIAIETTPDGDLYDAMTSALSQRTRTHGRFRTACRPARTPSGSAGSACAASGSRPCGCPQIWTFPECFTGSMSAFLSKGCVSVPASWNRYLDRPVDIPN